MPKSAKFEPRSRTWSGWLKTAPWVRELQMQMRTRFSQFSKWQEGSFQMPFKQLRRLTLMTLVLSGRRTTIWLRLWKEEHAGNWSCRTKPSLILWRERWCVRNSSSSKTHRDKSLIWMRLPTMTKTSLILWREQRCQKFGWKAQRKLLNMDETTH